MNLKKFCNRNPDHIDISTFCTFSTVEFKGSCWGPEGIFSSSLASRDKDDAFLPIPPNPLSHCLLLRKFLICLLCSPLLSSALPAADFPCSGMLGMVSGLISDAQISASSYADRGWVAENARLLTGRSGWTGQQTRQPFKNEWLQVSDERVPKRFWLLKFFLNFFFCPCFFWRIYVLSYRN